MRTLAQPDNGAGYKSLYSFKAGKDGEEPLAGLTEVNGVLYGTTAGGGESDAGTVFKITTSGTEGVLYSFKGPPDGAGPYAGLTNVNGTLYGTTKSGGSGCYDPSGCGTVFEVSTSGKERVLHRFKGHPDGAYPLAGLIDVNGTLYGTTEGGGTPHCGTRGDSGCGTVFEVSISGKERVLYRFITGGKDGSVPPSGLNRRTRRPLWHDVCRW